MNDPKALNLSNLTSCVVIGFGIGLLSGLASNWFMILLVVPLVTVYFVGMLMYELGKNQNAMIESRRRIKLLEDILAAGEGKAANESA